MYSTDASVQAILEPHVVEEALQYHDAVAKSQLERIMSSAANPIKLSKSDWEWAKLPVAKCGGMGLHDLPLIKLAAYMAAMGAVAKRAVAIRSSTGSERHTRCGRGSIMIMVVLNER